MWYVPRKTLWKTLLVVFFLLGVNPLIGTPGREHSGLMPVQAAGQPDILRSFPQQVEDGNKIYLPTITQPARIELTQTWTADELRTPREAFLPGKVIRYYGKGYINIPDAGVVKLKWSVIGPCESKTLFDGTGQINQGQWMLYQTDIAPNCPGVYVYTLRMEYKNEITFDTVSYVVNNPSEVGTLSLQGFDKCNIPYGSKTHSINQMQAWWNLSPYYSINLYIGGISRYCSNTELDAVWVNRVAQQGWSFIPTWVGPQAPCTDYRYRFSSDPATAYRQGVLEANAAVEAARNLGFLGNTVIYYDLEMYSTTNLTCRTAANTFLAGWSERLQDHGIRSGVYGHRINVNDWSTIAYPATPQNAWVASWVRSYYDPNISAYGIPGISDSLWSGRRIRQYAGDHVESYGGYAFGIDSNIMDGEVTVLPGSIASASGTIDGDPSAAVDTYLTNYSAQPNGQIQDLQLITGEQGWALVDQKIVWTANGGSTWSDITSPSIEPGSIMAVHFVDERSGWVVTQDQYTGELDVFITNSSGGDWNKSVLMAGSTDIGPLASAVYLDFLDPQTGWAVVKLISSTNFSTGKLFHTADGGVSWDELPVPLGEPVRFQDQQRGWVAGGPTGNQIFFTQNGGRTWEEQSIDYLSTQLAGDLQISLPAFEDGQNGLLPVTVYQSGSSRVEVLETHDGGITWQKSQRSSSDIPEISASSYDQAVTGSSGLPEGVVKVQLNPDGQGWAQVQQTECSGSKLLFHETNSISDSFRCVKRSSLLRTDDGGETWVDITPK